MQVSIRDLKNHLSKYLHLVEEGENILVTSHHKPLAKIIAVPRITNSSLQELLNLEGLHWNGKKPKGAEFCPKLSGKTAAEYLLEDRR